MTKYCESIEFTAFFKFKKFFKKLLTCSIFYDNIVLENCILKIIYCILESHVRQRINKVGCRGCLARQRERCRVFVLYMVFVLYRVFVVISIIFRRVNEMKVNNFVTEHLGNFHWLTPLQKEFPEWYTTRAIRLSDEVKNGQCPVYELVFRPWSTLDNPQHVNFVGMVNI